MYAGRTGTRNGLGVSFESLESRTLLSGAAFEYGYADGGAAGAAGAAGNTQPADALGLGTPGEISGIKWEDRDGDGARDPGEPGIAGWTIYLDTNGNRQLDAGEPSTTTGAGGAYAFSGLAPATYTVVEVARPDWSQTFPSAGASPAVADADTVLLERFEGSTAGTAFGGPAYAPSFSGLGSAVVFGPGKYVRYRLLPWYGSGPGSNPTTQGTIEMWFKADTTGDLLDFNWNVASSYPPAGHIVSMGPALTTGIPYISCWNFEFPRSIDGPEAVATGRWAHLAASWSPAGSKLYVNGQVVASSPANVYPAFFDASSPFYAYLNMWGTSGFNGLVDELHISRVQRPDAAILQHAAQGGTHTVTLVAGEGATNLDFGSRRTGTTPLAVSSGAFEPQAPNRLRLEFSTDVAATLAREDLRVVNRATGETVPASDFTLSVSGGGLDPTAAVWAAASGLPNGNYRATLPAGSVADGAGNSLTSDYVLDFFVLAGDINRDRFVNGIDFAILATNFGRTGVAYAEGDLSGDNSVNGTDFAVLAGNFGKSVPAPAVASRTFATFAARTATTSAPVAARSAVQPASRPKQQSRQPRRHLSVRRADRPPALLSRSPQL
jgi:hypothetical protein